MALIKQIITDTKKLRLIMGGNLSNCPFLFNNDNNPPKKALLPKGTSSWKHEDIVRQNKLDIALTAV